jgi:hypothetical protein
MGAIIDKLSSVKDKGPFLEILVEEVLKNQNFKNVKRQKNGSQFGYDLIGYKETNGGTECCKVECKNLKKNATVVDIAPKLMWHVNSEYINRFIIVSPLGISNELQFLLEQKPFYFPVEVWQGDYLEKIIFECEQARKMIGVENFLVDINATPVILPAGEMMFDVYNPVHIPFSYDYFTDDAGRLVRSYTEQNFAINVTIDNPTQENFIVTELNIKTTDFKEINRRILREYKLKGTVEQTKFEFSPRNQIEGITQILNTGTLFEVKPDSVENICLMLSDNAAPGYYQFIVEIRGRLRSNTVTMYSQIFSLHIPASDADVCRLCVVGKYYDSPVVKILNLSADEWSLIKNRPKNSIAFLGPTINSIPRGDFYNEWKISELEGTIDGHQMTINPSSTDKQVLNLSIPIEEELYSLNDVIRQLGLTLFNEKK